MKAAGEKKEEKPEEKKEEKKEEKMNEEEAKKKEEEERKRKEEAKEARAAKKRKERELELKRRKELERQIFQSEEIAHVKLKCGGHAYVPGKKLRDEIQVTIKTFFGSRRKFVFRVGIQDRAETLREMLVAADETGELKHYQDIKIFYPMG